MTRSARGLITLILILSSAQLSADTLDIPKVGYHVWYDVRLGIPVRTEYLLPRSMLRRVADRQDMSFYPDMILPAPQVRPSCYTRTGYDRGHNVPAADKAGSPAQMVETFAMSNISPQLPEFNRKRWKGVEDLVRSLSRRYGHVRVVTMPVFLYPDTMWLPCRHVAIPDGFRKQVFRWPTYELLLDTILWQRRLSPEESETITR